MNNLEQLHQINKEYDFSAFIEKQRKDLFRSQENPRKVPQWYFGKKADSPRNFFERNLILLLAFIFMICLANLGMILFFIFKFL